MISLVRAAWQEELRTPMFVGLSTDGFPAKTDPAMKNGARCYHMDTAKEHEYSAEDEQWYEVPQSGGGGEPAAYIKSATVSGNTLILTKKDNTTVEFTPSGTVITAESNTTINNYQVPQLTAEQVHAAYNAVATGKSVTIIDATETMMFSGLNADVVSDEIFISFRYFDKMILEYDEMGNITYKVIASNAGDVAYDSTTTYASGTVGAELNGVNALLGSGVIS